METATDHSLLREKYINISPKSTGEKHPLRRGWSRALVEELEHGFRCFSVYWGDGFTMRKPRRSPGKL